MKLTEEAIAEIKALEDRRGRLTPEQVVEAARAETSAIHGCFEWDDSVAAEKFRIDQARELLKRVKIEVTIEERTVRTVGYVRDVTQETGISGYIATLKVRAVDSPALIRAELQAIGADLARAATLALVKSVELPGVADRILAIKAQVDKLAGAVVDWSG